MKTMKTLMVMFTGRAGVSAFPSDGEEL